MTSLLRLLSFNASIQPELYPSTLDENLYHPIIRRKIITAFLVASGVDLDLICLQGFVPTDFKGILRLLPSFDGFISPVSGCALLVRRSSFDSIQFEDHDGIVRLRTIPTGTEREIQIWSVDLDEETIIEFEPGPQIVAGRFPDKMLKAQGLIDALRKVGNFEQTRPFEQSTGLNDHLFIQDVKPVSGDVDDCIVFQQFHGPLWSIKSENHRIEAVLNTYGSDHLPIRAQIRI